MFTQNKLSPEAIRKIESIIEYHMDKFGAPGCCIAVVKGNETIFLRGFGICEINKTEKIDDQTIFGIGSVSKSFTCLGILLLHEEGKINIEDPISKYLPVELEGKEHNIRIKHLMNHSSGIPNIFLALIIEKQLKYRKSYDSINISGRKINSWEDLYAYLREISKYITTNPGERFHYSDTSFTLLSKIIEIASGQKFPEFITERILKPLEMYRSQIRSKFDKNTKNIAYGHFVTAKDKKKFLEPVITNYPFSELLDGGGGILSSTENMTHYLTMIMNKGTYKEKQIIPSKIINTIHTSTLNIVSSEAEDKILGITEIDSFELGYGWFIDKNFFGTGKDRIFHFGNTGASSTYCGFEPNKRMGFIFFSNISKIDYETLNLLFLTLLEEIEVNFDTKELLNIFLELVGEYQSIGKISNLSVSLKEENLHLEGSIPDVNGIKNISGKLNVYPFRELQDDQKYSFFLDSRSLSLRTKAIFEKKEENTFLTLGIDKFKKSLK